MYRLKSFLLFSILSLYAPAIHLFAQNDRPLLRFGLFADTQYGNCPSERSRYYRNSLQKLEDCIRYFNSQAVEFSINLGDITDRNINDLDSVMVRLKSANHPIYSTTGNHDYKNVTDNRVLYKKLNMPSAYYAFRKKNWLFIFLNTNEIATYANIKGTPKEQELAVLKAHIKSTGSPQGANWNGGISARQLKWLDQLLAKSDKRGTHVLIFSHHPLYPQSAFTALNDQEILNVIDRHSCVRAIFSGHHHAGGFAYFKGIPAITIEGMIETPDENSFGIVKIYDNRIIVEGKGRMTSRNLKLDESAESPGPAGERP